MSDDRVWDLPACRREFGRLQAAHDELARDMQRTAADLAHAVYRRSLAEARLTTLQRELDASQRRERALLAELTTCKRDAGASHTQLATVTPLLPPKGRR